MTKVNHIANIRKRVQEMLEARVKADVQKGLEHQLLYGQSFVKVTWDPETEKLRAEQTDPDRFRFPFPCAPVGSGWGNPDDRAIEEARKIARQIEDVRIQKRLAEIEERIEQNIGDHKDCIIKLPEGVSLSLAAPIFCDHEFVNVSFNHIKMVCKHCDREQI